MEWAFELYLRSGIKASTERDQAQVQPFALQVDLAVSLTNHFRATPALVRYGAALCLHTIIKLSPAFLDENKYFYIYVISGLLDTDYQTCFIYESLLQLVDSPQSSQIKAALAQVHRAGNQVLSYDRLYVEMTPCDEIEAARAHLLHIITKQTPPVASILLHKMANALDYMNHSEKIRQLKLIQFWGQANGKIDAYLMQILIPLCSSSEESLQIAGLKVIHGLMPGFADASPADTSFVWTFLYPLLDNSQKSSLLLEIIELLKLFPIKQLATAQREQLFSALLKLFFFNEPIVRLNVYKFIGGNGDLWKQTGDYWKTLSLLFLALGDSDQNW